jgi:RNA polymerase sigma-70 factor, ECF subfamily
MTFDRAALNHLFQYCLSLCGQEADAYDLLHNALEKFLKTKSASINSPTAYIKTIARNHFFDQERRRKKLQFDVLEDSNQVVDTEQHLENMVVDELTLRTVWKTLSPAEREVMFLWSAEGLSASEIAEQLSIPRATVLSRLHRLRIRLQANPKFASIGGQHD